MNTLFNDIQHLMAQGRDAVLVAIVGHSGSAPRTTGALMLVDAAGRRSGSVGGGAVEAEAVRIAQVLAAKGHSSVQDFSLHRAEENDIGMVCGGDVQLGFFFIPSNSEPWQRAIADACDRLSRDAGGFLHLPYRDDAPFVSETMADEAYYSLPLPCKTRVVIFGAGHIARALVPLLDTVDFSTVVYDCRREYTQKSDFPQASRVLCGPYETLSFTPERDDFAVVMTHGHSHDHDVLLQILPLELPYVGVIGSRSKTAAVNQRLWDAGIPRTCTDRVHSPIGTAIRAVTPQEIAVSIAGELILHRALLREGQNQPHHPCPVH